MNMTFLIPPALLLLLACSNAAQQHSENAIGTSPPQEKIQQTTSQVTLPDSATAFIQQHFASETLQQVTAKKSPTAEGMFYEVTLTDGTELDFGRAGNWMEANADEPGQLPITFFPDAIRAYLETNFAGIGVESIDQDRRGYELELTNGINLHFDGAGSFIRREK